MRWNLNAGDRLTTTAYSILTDCYCGRLLIGLSVNEWRHDKININSSMLNTLHSNNLGKLWTL